MTREKPNILHCTARCGYGICHEPYLVHGECWKLRNVEYFELITVYVGRNQRTADCSVCGKEPTDSLLQCMWEGTNGQLITVYVRRNQRTADYSVCGKEPTEIWLQCMWEGNNGKLITVYVGRNQRTADYSVCGKEPTDSWLQFAYLCQLPETPLGSVALVVYSTNTFSLSPPTALLASS